MQARENLAEAHGRKSTGEKLTGEKLAEAYRRKSTGEKLTGEKLTDASRRKTHGRKTDRSKREKNCRCSTVRAMKDPSAPA